jgi:hypothetical protein
VLSVAQNALVTHEPLVAQRSRWHTGAARAVLHAYPGSDTQPTSLVHGISEAHAALDASLASPGALPSLAELLSPTTPASLALTSTPWPVLHAARSEKERTGTITTDEIFSSMLGGDRSAADVAKKRPSGSARSGPRMPSAPSAFSLIAFDAELPEQVARDVLRSRS